MRVVCWNIERGYDPAAIASYLKSLKGDIYMLYELDRGVKRTKKVDMYKIIQDSLGLNGRYVREFYEIESPWRRIVPWGGPGGGETGNAFFSSFPIQGYGVKELPKQSPLLYERTTLIPELFQPRKGCRKSQHFQVTVNSKTITFISSHLELWRSGWEHRREQLAAAVGPYAESDRLVVAGDFNCVEGAIVSKIGRNRTAEVGKVREWLYRRGLNDPFNNEQVTSGRWGINAKLDWIAATKNMKITGYHSEKTDLSDHDCLIVDYSDDW